MTELEAIRVRGTAHERDEFVPDVSCIASVIVDHEGNAVGACAASILSSRFLTQRKDIASELLRAAETARSGAAR